MKVPLLDLAAQTEPLEAKLRQAFDEVLQSRAFILGPQVQALEEELATLHQVKHGIGVSSGSDAILASLMALGIGPGDEVIVPTFTFFATAGCAWRTGAKPVFVDIEPDTFNIDPQAVAAAVTERTKAIIPVHLYGQCADMDAINAIADEHSLVVIEDAAQAVSASYKDRPACSLGTAGTLSFYPTKNLSGMGEGGMVLTNDDALADKLRMVRDHGQRPQYHYHLIGGNFRLDGIQGAMLRVKLEALAQWTQRRRDHAKRYTDALKGTSITPPIEKPECKHVYHQYTVRCAQRDELRTHLSDAGIGSGIYYPIPLHLQPCFADLGHKVGDCPVAEKAADEVLSLPIFAEMSQQQQDYVIEQLLKFAKK